MRPICMHILNDKQLGLSSSSLFIAHASKRPYKLTSNMSSQPLFTNRAYILITPKSLALYKAILRRYVHFNAPQFSLKNISLQVNYMWVYLFGIEIPILLFLFAFRKRYITYNNKHRRIFNTYDRSHYTLNKVWPNGISALCGYRYNESARFVEEHHTLITYLTHPSGHSNQPKLCKYITGARIIGFICVFSTSRKKMEYASTRSMNDAWCLCGLLSHTPLSSH